MKKGSGIGKILGAALAFVLIVSIFGSLGIAFTSNTAEASSTTIYAAADGYAWSGGTSNPSGGNSGVDYLRVGFSTASGNYRTLLKFDLSSIPAGAIITSADLNLYYYAAGGTDGDPLDISVYQTAVDWSEGSLTWSKAENYYVPSYDTVTIIKGSGAGYKAWDIASLVQNWVDGTYDNYGVLLRAPTQSGSSIYRTFHSKEYGSNAPKLEVTYTTPAPAIKLDLYRISDTTDTPNTSSPGTAKTEFLPGDTVRVTLRADNTGATADVKVTLNIRNPDNSTLLYDSHDPTTTDSGSLEDNTTGSPLTSTEGYDYYSFDKMIPVDADPGWYDIGGAIRNQAWTELWDTTAPGRADEDWDNAWLLNKFEVLPMGQCETWKTYYVTYPDSSLSCSSDTGSSWGIAGYTHECSGMKAGGEMWSYIDAWAGPGWGAASVYADPMLSSESWVCPRSSNYRITTRFQYNGRCHHGGMDAWPLGMAHVELDFGFNIEIYDATSGYNVVDHTEHIDPFPIVKEGNWSEETWLLDLQFVEIPSIYLEIDHEYIFRFMVYTTIDVFADGAGIASATMDFYTEQNYHIKRQWTEIEDLSPVGIDEGDICNYGPWEPVPGNECKERRLIYRCSSGSCVSFGQYEERDLDAGVICGYGDWEPVPGNDCKERRLIYECSGGSCVSSGQYEERNLAGDICNYGPWEDDPGNPCKERRLVYKCSGGSCASDGYEYRNANEGEVCDYGPWEDDPGNPCKERRLLYKCSSGSCAPDGYEYEFKDCTLTVAVDGVGDTAPSPGIHTYDCCTDVTITAIETDPDWEFSHWSGDASGSSLSVTVHMDRDKSVIAHFTNGGKAGDVNGDGRVNVQDMVRIGQHWGQTGPAGWIPEDVKKDGQINVQDMVIIGQNWTG